MNSINLFYIEKDSYEARDGSSGSSGRRFCPRDGELLELGSQLTGPASAAENQPPHFLKSVSFFSIFIKII